MIFGYVTAVHQIRWNLVSFHRIMCIDCLSVAVLEWSYFASVPVANLILLENSCWWEKDSRDFLLVQKKCARFWINDWRGLTVIRQRLRWEDGEVGTVPSLAGARSHCSAWRQDWEPSCSRCQTVSCLERERAVRSCWIPAVQRSVSWHDHTLASQISWGVPWHCEG